MASDLRKRLSTSRSVSREFGFRDFESFRSFWIRKGASGDGGWQARRDLLATLFTPIHDRFEVVAAGGSGPKVTEEALSALNDPAAIRDHLERIERNLDDDPRLAVGSAKELVESTAKLVLKRSGIEYGKSDDLPSLVAKAHTALGMNAKQVDDNAENAVGTGPCWALCPGSGWEWRNCVIRSELATGKPRFRPG